jgi:hypothetical protein
MSKEKEYELPINHKVLFKFRSHFNVYWSNEIQGFKGFTYMRGFPGTMYFTNRRLIIVAYFSEKMGWFQRKKTHQLGFEASLSEVKSWDISTDQKGNLVGNILFNPHGMLGETTIQFIKLQSNIANAIREYFSKQQIIKKPLQDSGIVIIGQNPVEWANERFSK